MANTPVKCGPQVVAYTTQQAAAPTFPFESIGRESLLEIINLRLDSDNRTIDLHRKMGRATYHKRKLVQK